MFWPFLGLGTIVMVGWFVLTLVTGGWGVLVRGSGPISQPVVVSGPASALEVPDMIYHRGGDPAASPTLECTLPGHPKGRVSHDFSAFGTQTVVGPDGETYERGPQISWGPGEGNTVVCTSSTGITHIVVGQEQTQTKLMMLGLTGFTALGGAVLTALGHWAARRQRAG